MLHLALSAQRLPYLGIRDLKKLLQARTVGKSILITGHARIERGYIAMV